MASGSLVAALVMIALLLARESTGGVLSVTSSVLQPNAVLLARSARSVVPPLTIEAWVRLGSATSDATILSYVDCTPAKGPGGLVTGELELGPNALTLNVTGGALTFGYLRAAAQTSTAFFSLSANVWTHVAVTFSGSSVEFYRNATHVATMAWTGPTTTNETTGALAIGGQITACPGATGMPGTETAASLVGDLDEVRVWETARTAAELLASYVAGLARAPPQLRSWWRFDSTAPWGGFADDGATGGADLELVVFTLAQVWASDARGPVCGHAFAWNVAAPRVSGGFHMWLVSALPLSATPALAAFSVTGGVLDSVTDVSGERRVFAVSGRGPAPAVCDAVTLSFASASALPDAASAHLDGGVGACGTLAAITVVVPAATSGTMRWVDVPTSATVGDVLDVVLALPAQPADVSIPVSLSGAAATLWLPAGPQADIVTVAVVSATSVNARVLAGQTFSLPLRLFVRAAGTVTLTLGTPAGLVGGAELCLALAPAHVITVAAAPTLADGRGPVLLLVGNPPRERAATPFAPADATACTLTPVDRMWVAALRRETQWTGSPLIIGAVDELPALASLVAAVVVSDSVPVAALSGVTATALTTLAVPLLVASPSGALALGLASAAVTTPSVSALVAGAAAEFAASTPAAAGLALETPASLVALTPSFAGASALVALAGSGGTLVASGQVGSAIRVIAGLPSSLDAQLAGASAAHQPPWLVYATRAALAALCPLRLAVVLSPAPVSAATGRPTVAVTVDAAGVSTLFPSVRVDLLSRATGALFTSVPVTIKLSLVSAELAEFAPAGAVVADAPLFGAREQTTVSGSATFALLRVGTALSAVRFVARVYNGMSPVAVGLSSYFDVTFDASAAASAADDGVGEVFAGGQFAARLAIMRTDSRAWRAAPAVVASTLGAAVPQAVSTGCSPFSRRCVGGSSSVVIGSSGGPAALLVVDLLASTVTPLSLGAGAPSTGGSVYAFAPPLVQGMGLALGDWSGAPGSATNASYLLFDQGMANVSAGMGTVGQPASFAARAATALARSQTLSSWLVLLAGDDWVVGYELGGGSWQTYARGVAGVRTAAVCHAHGVAYLGRLVGSAAPDAADGESLLALPTDNPARGVQLVSGASFLRSGSVLASVCSTPATAVSPALCVFGGTFVDASGDARDRLVRFDGTTFSAVGSGIVGGSVRALAIDAESGFVYVGGDFVAGHVPDCPACSYVARFALDGSSGLHAPHLSLALALGPVYALAVSHLAPTRAVVVLTGAPTAVVRGDVFTVTFAIPDPVRRAALFSTTAAAARLTVTSGSSEAAAIAPDDWVVFDQDAPSGQQIGFAVRALATGVLSLTLTVADARGALVGPSAPVLVTVGERAVGSAQPLVALLVHDMSNGWLGVGSGAVCASTAACADGELESVLALLEPLFATVLFANGADGSFTSRVAARAVFDVVVTASASAARAAAGALTHARASLVVLDSAVCVAPYVPLVSTSSANLSELGVASAAEPTTLDAAATVYVLNASDPFAAPLLSAAAGTGVVRLAAGAVQLPQLRVAPPLLRPVARAVSAPSGTASLVYARPHDETTDCEFAPGARVLVPTGVWAATNPTGRALFGQWALIAAQAPWAAAAASVTPPPPVPTPPPSPGSITPAASLPPPPPAQTVLATSEAQESFFVRNLTAIGFVFGALLAVVLLVGATLIARQRRLVRKRRVADLVASPLGNELFKTNGVELARAAPLSSASRAPIRASAIIVKPGATAAAGW